MALGFRVFLLKVLSEFSNSRVWSFPSHEALSTAPLKEKEGGIRVGQVGNRRTNDSFVIAEPPDIVGSVSNMSSVIATLKSTRMVNCC